MRIELGLRAGIALPLLATLFFGMAAIFIFNYYFQVNLLKEEEQRSIEASVNTAHILLETSTINYQQMAMLVSKIPDVQEAIYKKDRNRLISLFQPVFISLKDNFGLAQVQFHLPPAMSFIRFHDLEKYGDDLSAFRKTVVQVATTNRGVRGPEVGVVGLSLRGVEPIFYKDNYVGSVEFGGEINVELEKIKRAINADLGIVVLKEPLSVWEGLKNVKYTFGQWVSIYFTKQDPKLFISENALKRATQSKEKYYTELVSAEGKEYIVVYSPFKDFSGKIKNILYCKRKAPQPC